MYIYNKPRSRLGLQNTAVGCPRGVMVKAMDCGIVVSEFVRSLSGKYPWERYEPLILPAMG